MIIYLVLLALAIYFSFQSHKNQVKATYFLMAIMLLMCGLRGENVGTDTAAYLYFAEGYSDGDNLGVMYKFLRFISAKIGKSPNIFLMLMAILTYVPLTLIIVKESEKPAVSVLLYMSSTSLFFLETFNISRQAIAIVFLLWSAYYLKYDNWLLSVLYFIISFLFHPFIFPFAIIYIINRIEIKPWIVTLCLTVSFVVGFVGVLDQIKTAVDMLYLFTEGSDYALIEHLGKYHDRDFSATANFVGKMVHMLPVTLLCWFSYDKKTSSNNIYFKMLLVGAIVTNLFVSTLYCERIASIFTLALILVVPASLKNLGQKSLKLVMIIGITIFLYVYTLWTINTNPRDYAKTVPYSTCFMK